MAATRRYADTVIAHRSSSPPQLCIITEASSLPAAPSTRSSFFFQFLISFPRFTDCIPFVSVFFPFLIAVISPLVVFIVALALPQGESPVTAPSWETLKKLGGREREKTKLTGRSEKGKSFFCFVMTTFPTPVCVCGHCRGHAVTPLPKVCQLQRDGKVQSRGPPLVMTPTAVLGTLPGCFSLPSVLPSLDHREAVLRRATSHSQTSQNAIYEWGKKR